MSSQTETPLQILQKNLQNDLVEKLQKHIISITEEEEVIMPDYEITIRMFIDIYYNGYCKFNDILHIQNLFWDLEYGEKYDILMDLDEEYDIVEPEDYDEVLNEQIMYYYWSYYAETLLTNNVYIIYNPKLEGLMNCLKNMSKVEFNGLKHSRLLKLSYKLPIKEELDKTKLTADLIEKVIKLI